MSIHVTVSVFGEDVALSAQADTGGRLVAVFLHFTSPDGRVNLGVDVDNVLNLATALEQLAPKLRSIADENANRRELDAAAIDRACATRGRVEL